VTDKRPVAQTFEEVRWLVHSFINQYYRKYRIDRDLLVAAAYYGFMQAYGTYDPRYGEFTTWVGVKVKRRLSDELRKKINERKRVATGAGLDLLPDPEVIEPEFDTVAFFRKLSDDAQTVAGLVISKPIDVRLVLSQLGPDSPANWRQALREVLGELGWEKDRIHKAFLEIKEAL